MRDLLLLVIAVLAVTGNAFAEIHEVPTKCPESSGKTVQLAHKHDCTKFYECSNGQKQLSNCPEFAPGQKLHFDPELQNCTFPWKANCASRAPEPSNFKETDLATYFVPHAAEERDVVDCPPEGYTFIPHECSCNNYYSCEDGNRFVEKCPEGMIYDYIRKVCDLPHAAICKNQKYTEDSFLDPNCYNSTDCPLGSHARFPHSECRLYYECYGGRKCLRTCGVGLVYNPAFEVCDLPKNVPGCGGGGSNEPDDTTPNNTDYECTPCSNCYNCISRLAYPEDCNQYYQCVHGQKVRKQCPRNLVFDPINQICDYQENVHCVPTTTTTTTTTTTVRPQCYEGQRRHHECQCQEYYECHNGREQWFRCSSDKLFDWLELECVARDKATCYPKLKNDCEGTCSSSNSVLPHKECNKYCTCDRGTTTVQTCPRHMYYDRYTQRCDWPENINYLSTNCDPTNCILGFKNVPHECRCDRYYVCSGSRKDIVFCEEGQYFDYREERCVDKKLAHCYVSPLCDEIKKCGICESTKHNTSNYADDCQRYCKCSGRSVHIEQCARGLYYDIESGECAWPENVSNKTQCPLITDCTRTSTVVPHNCECKLYYTCEEGAKYPLECPAGLFFDYILGYCVHRDAHCYHEYSENKTAKYCEGHCPEQTSSSPIIRLQHRDCNKYCICSMGAPYVVECTECSRYDNQLQTCVPSYPCDCNMQASKSLWSDIPFINNFL